MVFLLLESALRPPCPTPSACVNENKDNYFSKVWLRRKLLLKNEGESASDNWKNLDWALPWEKRERRAKRTKRTGWAKKWEEPREKNEPRELRKCVDKMAVLYRKEKLGEGKLRSPWVEAGWKVLGWAIGTKWDLSPVSLEPDTRISKNIFLLKSVRASPQYLWQYIKY